MCSRYVRTSEGTRVPVQQVRTFSSNTYLQQLAVFFSSTYVRASTTGTCRSTSVGAVHAYRMQVRQVLVYSVAVPFFSICKRTYISSANCKCSSTQYVLHSGRYSTCAYSRYSRYSSRYIRYVHKAVDTSVGVCSTCVGTEEVATSLQRPGNAIDHGELNITVF